MYGWAFLVMIAVITGITQLDVLQDTQGTQTRCDTNTLLACDEDRVLVGNQTVILTLQNSGGNTVVINNPAIHTRHENTSCLPRTTQARTGSAVTFLCQGVNTATEDYELVFEERSADTPPRYTRRETVSLTAQQTEIDQGLIQNLTESLDGTFTDPTALPGAVQWLDAADQSTFTTNESGSISQWRDKSGTNTHFSQPTPQHQPRLADNTVTAETEDYFTATNPLENAEAITAFVVGSAKTSTSGSAATIIRAKSSWLIQKSGSNLLSAAIWAPSSGLVSWNQEGIKFQDEHSYDETFLFTWAWNGTQYQYRDAGADTGTRPADTDTNNPGTTYTAFQAPNSNHKYAGALHEVILYNAPLPIEDQRRIEGYLAHKWNLTTQLPTTHPYKDTEPTY